MISEKKEITSRGPDENDLTGLVISDIKEVFSSMVGRTDLSPLSERIDPLTHFENGLTAMVGMAGIYNGVIGLHAPDELAMGFTSDMLGMTVTEINNDVHDAMGEIANMIAGAIKLRLSRGGGDIRLSIPSVVIGRDYFAAAGSPRNAQTFGFSTNQGNFLVSAALKRDGETACTSGA